MKEKEEAIHDIVAEFTVGTITVIRNEIPHARTVRSIAEYFEDRIRNKTHFCVSTFKNGGLRVDEKASLRTLYGGGWQDKMLRRSTATRVLKCLEQTICFDEQIEDLLDKSKDRYMFNQSFLLDGNPPSENVVEKLRSQMVYGLL